MLYIKNPQSGQAFSASPTKCGSFRLRIDGVKYESFKSVRTFLLVAGFGSAVG
jgi:hypothetical protein